MLNFATSIAHCTTSTTTTNTAFFPMLSDIIPRDSFDKDGPRFQELLSRATDDHLPSVAALQLAWNQLRTEVAGSAGRARCEGHSISLLTLQVVIILPTSNTRSRLNVKPPPAPPTS